MKNLTTSDEPLAHLLRAWHRTFVGTPASVLEVILMAESQRNKTGTEPELRTALLGLGKSAKNALTIGKFLAKNCPKTIGPYTLTRTWNGKLKVWKYLVTKSKGKVPRGPKPIKTRPEPPKAPASLTGKTVTMPDGEVLSLEDVPDDHEEIQRIMADAARQRQHSPGAVEDFETGFWGLVNDPVHAAKDAWSDRVEEQIDRESRKAQAQRRNAPTPAAQPVHVAPVVVADVMPVADDAEVWCGAFDDVDHAEAARKALHRCVTAFDAKASAVVVEINGQWFAKSAGCVDARATADAMRRMHRIVARVGFYGIVPTHERKPVAAETGARFAVHDAAQVAPRKAWTP